LRFFAEFNDLSLRRGGAFKLRSEHHFAIKDNKQYMYLAKE